jgi:hypothetical protein
LGGTGSFGSRGGAIWISDELQVTDGFESGDTTAWSSVVP